MFIAQKLGEDINSPFYNKIYKGGKKAISADIPLRGIKSGIEYLLSRSIKLPQLENTDAQYIVIKNYFSAFKKVHPKSWETPKDYLTLRGAGLWAVCMIGANVIDRALTKNKFDVDPMIDILKSGKEWD